jgi:cbb3-type cytochrome oxidase maturation protein
MSSLIILIPVSVLLVGVAIWAFFWAVDSGQFDDLDSPALDMLRDDLQARGDVREQDLP